MSNPRKYRVLIVGIIVVACLVVMVVSIGVGAMKISPLEVITSLWNRVIGESATAATDNVIWKLRLPRVLLGFLVGATLGVSGAMMQGLFRNPLADPGLIGVSSGAALGAVFILVLGGYLLPGYAWASDLRLLPVAAVIGAALITILIHRIATVHGQTAVATLLLAGVAVNAISGAVIGLATFLATDSQLRSLSFWTMGSLGSASWKMLGITAVPCLLLLFVAPRMANALNAFALGEAEAGHLGVSGEKLKRRVILLTAVGVGTCVSMTGMIGFIGLVVPHLIRLMIGPDHRWLVPCSALLGGTLLVLGDAFARTLVAPAELPIGILTAAFGGPFFLWMLLSQRKNFVVQ